MNALEYLQEIVRTIPELARQTGHSTAGMYLSFLRCYFSQHMLLEEFHTLHMYDFSNMKASSFLTERRRGKLAAIVNAGAGAEDFADFNEKHRFNARFHEYVQRDWLYMPDASDEDVRAFIARNPAFLTKADALTQGKGIERHQSQSLDVDAFLRTYRAQPVLLEALIRQHPALAALNPTSVNTIRIVSVRREQDVLLPGACLRAGGSGSCVDNFHKGGVGYPLDMETGIVSGLGRGVQGRPVFLRHPSTGHIMPGFQVPRWEELKERVRQAALSSAVGYIGWDVAVTEDGLEFVEGNVSTPDPVLIQLDDNGLYPRIKEFLQTAK